MEKGGGHSETSPDGKWTVSVYDGLGADVEMVILEVFKGADIQYRQVPVLVYTSPLPGFYARSDKTTATWSEDGKECHFKLSGYCGEPSLIVVPSEGRVTFDPLACFGYRKAIDPEIWVLLFGGLALAYILGLLTRGAKKSQA
jgi:hypothetical protein